MNFGEGLYLEPGLAVGDLVVPQVQPVQGAGERLEGARLRGGNLGNFSNIDPWSNFENGIFCYVDESKNFKQSNMNDNCYNMNEQPFNSFRLKAPG